MQQDSQSLVQSLFDQNPRFRLLYEEHQLLEKDLESLTRKSFLTAEEELEKRKLQKLKLAGKDEMERILNNYR
ncbi:MAG: YdcH family protein [Desulfuromonadales bacterium]|nr:YdcH family protein [Desulfuromonadales bacterium]MDW7758209.1 YdcH family protein [Desulfuromonadales bacterium]